MQCRVKYYYTATWAFTLLFELFWAPIAILYLSKNLHKGYSERWKYTIIIMKSVDAEFNLQEFCRTEWADHTHSPFSQSPCSPQQKRQKFFLKKTKLQLWHIKYLQIYNTTSQRDYQSIIYNLKEVDFLFLKK